MSEHSFKNRIVGHGEKPADQFVNNPDNPRVHPQKQRDAIEGSLNTLGFIAPVIVNKNTGYLVDGHERIWQALANGDDTPVPYIEVDLSPDEEKLALAVFDWTTVLADYDRDMLDSLLQDVQTDDANLQTMLADMAIELDLYPDPDADDGMYTRKIETPIYEPSGDKPVINDLFDDARTQQLVSDIESSEILTDAEKVFLTKAAQRHTIFNFSNIANFYAHSSADVQRFMEDSALVIIDYDRAIELGFVKLTNDIAALEAEDNG